MVSGSLHVWRAVAIFVPVIKTNLEEFVKYDESCTCLQALISD